MTKISVITPAYKAARHLPAAIASLFGQTHADWELIVVNDGSTDGTATFLDGSHDPRIRVIFQGKDRQGLNCASAQHCRDSFGIWQ